ncbi:MAG: thioredoxin domain-containing protein, partial [Flavobacteriaceae bacterium]|nr:thioredoxin domain-containing protein [Flavobacteriaceae bacterium]
TQKVYLTSSLQKHLIARPVDYRDNVIASSAAQFAHNALLLGLLTEDEAYEHTAKVLLQKTLSEAEDYPIMYAHWLTLWNRFTYPYYEVVIAGPKAYEFKENLEKNYLPNAVFLALDKASDLPAFEHRFVSGETFIYVCLNKVCKLPVQHIDEALQLLSE